MRFTPFQAFVRTFRPLASPAVRANPAASRTTRHRAPLLRSMLHIPFLSALFGTSPAMADNTKYPVQKTEGEWQAQLSPGACRGAPPAHQGAR